MTNRIEFRRMRVETLKYRTLLSADSGTFGFSDPSTEHVVPQAAVYVAATDVPTETNERGELPLLPQTRDWIDEWESVYVEIWSGLTGADSGIEYRTPPITIESPWVRSRADHM